MKDSNFTFLQTTYPDLFTLGELAEKLISIDPNSSLTKSRLFAEKLTALIWSFEELDATDVRGSIQNVAWTKCRTKYVKPLVHR